MKVEVAPDPHAAAAVAARLIAGWLRDAIAARGRASLALSRVSEPYDLFHALESSDVEWEHVDLFQVDERIAPDGDPDRNAVALQEFALRLPGRPSVHLMPVNPPDPEQYAATLHTVSGGVLDVIHLGLGPDGHTASWPPGSGMEDVIDRDVAVCPEYQDRERVTLTVPCVNRARRVVFLATGPSKVDALARLLADQPTIPAHHVRRGDDTVVVADEAAMNASSGGA
ncbi:MAG: 6-phosphogluconolactonase [Acidimicrobiia bacterium]|nr:6-phosphogluconolactonase [Acidimicrobiia bacterium]